MKTDTRIVEWKAKGSQTVLTLSLLAMIGSAQGVSISDVPLFLPTPVAPNIIVTLDDSSSMAEAFAPELCGATWGGGTTTNCTCQSHTSNYGPASSYSINTDASIWEAVSWCDVNHIGENILDSRRYKSSTFNPIYYNPNTNYALPLDAAGNTLTAPAFSAAYYNGFDTSQGTTDLSTNYRPSIIVWQYPYNSNASFYNAHVAANHPSSDFASVNTGAPAYYYVYDTSIVGCSPQTSTTTNNDNCYTRVNVSATSGPGSSDERQNFANWYSFYRTRNLLTISGATRAFINLDPTTRVAWQALNSCNTFGTACSGSKSPAINLNNQINLFTGSHKSNFYAWLSRLPTGANSSFATPLRGGLRKAGQYYETSGDGSPYDNDFTTANSGEYTCRPNFHILMTDGIWNYGTGNTDSNTNVSLYGTIGNYDGASQTFPDNKAYSPSGSNQPYEDSNSSSLADTAFYYWARDLRGNLTNNQLPYYADRTGSATAQYWNAKNDLANWQHMVNFTVGLGLGSFLTSPAWGGSTYAGDYPSFVNGTTTWPATGPDVVPGNVYDLWHAALNSRGQFFSADDPQALTNALLATLDRITERQSSASALATNSTKLNAGTVVFQARFDSTDWTGQMIAYPVQSDGSLGNALWDAGDPAQNKIPAHGSRNILSWSGTAGTNFTWADLTASQKNLIDSANAAAGSSPVLNYLRGDTSNEQRNGGSYRNRSRPLGDIINSDPFFIGAPDFGYDTLAESATVSYQAFVNSNLTRDKMLYVGANDGMLHAFNVTTGGNEVFAFVPDAAMANLASLKNTAYAHKFFIDGSPFVGDAYFSNLGAWKTVLLGTTGAGGKSVFALDVTAPTTMTAANVLWEFTNTALGNTIGQPVIARLKNGRWAAVFGNGYNSNTAIPANSTAKLFIVFLDADPSNGWDLGSNADYMVIPTNTTINNGLSTVSLYDSNGDKIVDAAYAGDMQGNVWKFDLSDNNPNNWDSAYKSGGTPVPLFTACGNNSGACIPQPITAPIELGVAPSGQSGVMVYFGTGRFFATGDSADMSLQSLYGILDSGTRITSSLRSGLQQQSIIFEGADPGRTDDTSTANVNEARAASSQSLRVVSSNTVNYATKRGWYLDLVPPSGTAQGERVVSIPLLRHGRVIFTTIIPSTDPCAFGGTSWIMELDAMTGGRLGYSVFDLNNNGQFDATDFVTITIGGQSISVPVSAVQSNVGIIKTPTVISAGAVEYKLASGTTGNVSSTAERGGSLVTGRVSWRELIND